MKLGELELNEVQVSALCDLLSERSNQIEARKQTEAAWDAAIQTAERELAEGEAGWVKEFRRLGKVDRFDSWSFKGTSAERIAESTRVEARRFAVNRLSKAAQCGNQGSQTPPVEVPMSDLPVDPSREVRR